MYGLVGVGVREWVSFSGQTDVQQSPRGWPPSVYWPK